jgi:hypothetical protein
MPNATVRLTGQWITVDVSHKKESPRDRLLDLVDNGTIDAEHLAIMVAQFLTDDEVEKMLDLNELSARFDDDSEA